MAQCGTSQVMVAVVLLLSFALLQISYEAPVDRFPCGIPKFPLAHGPNRIAQGWKASKHSLPWHVHIFKINAFNETTGFQCGGSLIRLRPGNVSDLVLTAAHCLIDDETRAKVPPSRLEITVAVHDRTDIERTKVKALETTIGAYADRFSTDDIGVIRLAESVPYTDFTIPVCLPDVNAPLPVGKTCYVSGHGIIFSGTNVLPNELRMVNVDVLKEEDCAKQDFDSSQKIDLTKQFCAGGGGNAARAGDSGGPLVCVESGRFVQYGIVSYGLTDVMHMKAPGIYTFVPKFMDWIMQKDKILQPSKGVLPESSIHEFLSVVERINRQEKKWKSTSSVSRTKYSGNSLLPPEAHQCGVPSPKYPIITSPNRANRISAGWEAQKHSLPWMVLLTIVSEQNPSLDTVCGGTLISLQDGNHTDLVLTAASCVTMPSSTVRRNPSNCIVTIGAQKPYSPDTDEKKIGVKSFVVHPQYNVESTRSDIAVVRLEQSVPYTEATLPICLPSPGEEVPVGTECIIAGWGAVSKYYGLLADTLTMATVSIAPLNASGDVLYQIGEKEYICTKSELNRGYLEGDSGSPLICRKGVNWVQYGIASTRIAPCGRQLNTYIRISSYIGWIAQADLLMTKANAVFPADDIIEYLNPSELVRGQRRRTMGSYFLTKPQPSTFRKPEKWTNADLPTVGSSNRTKPSGKGVPQSIPKPKSSTPSPNSNVDQPALDLPRSTPSSDLNVDQPALDLPRSTPSLDLNVDQPALDLPRSTPSSDLSYIRPVGGLPSRTTSPISSYIRPIGGLPSRTTSPVSRFDLPKYSLPYRPASQKSPYLRPTLNLPSRISSRESGRTGFNSIVNTRYPIRRPTMFARYY
uniref:Peptidase S1 domain-containing protein n=1 Tax=Trichuris muris TaxID=70415 RepID=A0A5S6QP26_TRIMR